MVQLMRSDTDNHCLKKVKLEVQDEIPPLHTHKRPKLESPPKQCGASDESISIPPASYNPLDEPSPLGLRLRKSPSLLDLIQMRLSQQEESKKKDQKASSSSSVAAAAAAAADSKLKASNFPGTILKIGNWEYKSRYEGDLVAKCYFAKHKLVWEVLDGCLKNKIEIPWSDIMAIKANYPDDGPGTLEVVLARRPLFFREINPQPRKHTLWQATSDFTGGQAGINRRHFLQCPQGLLGKHFEKLIQCDPRLNYLSQQADLVLDSPYFEPGTTSIHDHIESSDGFDRKSEERSGIFGLQDVESGSAVQSSSSKSEHNLGKAVENVSQEITSPSSVMNIHAMKDFRSRGAETLKFLSNLDQIKLPGLHPSMSMDDLVSHIGHCISEQMGSDNPNFAGDNQYSRSILEEFTQYLFNDSQHATTSDEQRVMSKVNSLYCLLQKDPSTAEDMTKNGNSLGDANALSRVNSLYSLLQNAEDAMARNGNGLRDADVMSRVNSLYCLLQKDPYTAEDTNTMTRNGNGLDADEGGKVGVSNSNITELSQPCKTKVSDLEVQADDASGCKQGGTGMSRKESAGDLLLNLPRVASLPQFLFNMSEDSVNKVR
ncbi:hypothetical protein GLYMA_07G021300v4 [Glycine max]|uniref:uncharacterized protein isoform X1 n=1 Tax=Glycine max TaxID=3847 RepID=UPI0003DECAAA|nr:uncharacterized protein LOC100808320 isoform X1 [Glycine max]KAG4400258.1 hypothetical protein GLYMA_07G021300v4 [Glycine max]KAH1084975.1 hypothetical protein GYH30_017152 [Glycine max]|eukprot:XP_006583081.1 uncharacterized protein LOC100808320 isoform X1 [Glycine max]